MTNFEITCYRFWSDWTDLPKVLIDLDAWDRFIVEFRGENSWHIIGIKDDKEIELSLHGILYSSLVEFLAFMSTTKIDKWRTYVCKVYDFRKFHFGNCFIPEIARLLNDVNSSIKKLNESNDGKEAM